MTRQTFNATEGIPDDWAAYIENEAKALSQQEDFDIDNYADREILNPDVQNFLKELPANNTVPDAKAGMDALSLSGVESALSVFSSFGGKFRWLKKKIREILCKILADLAGDGDLNWKDIIKAVLIALIPALGGGPISVVVLPILISLIAKVIKRGIDKVCPVAA